MRFRGLLIAVAALALAACVYRIDIQQGNLLDEDDVTATGELEDELYAKRNPPYRAANLPLLSVDDLRMVDGFDGPLVEALRPFVGVYPLVGGGGINVNTAPPWVLMQIQRGSEVSGMRPVEEEDVERLVEAREEGPLCSGESPAPSCRPLSELLDGESIQPKPVERSTVFRIRSVARIFDVERSIETVVDRSDPAALDALVDRYWKLIFGRCHMLTLNPQQASDLAQEAWCRMLRARQSLKPDGNFPAYLTTVAMNAWRDAHRSARRAGPMAEHRLVSLDARIDQEEGDPVALADVLADLNSLQEEEQRLREDHGSRRSQVFSNAAPEQVSTSPRKSIQGNSS